LTKQEKQELVENFHQFNRLKHSPVTPNAFPEKGLYMLVASAATLSLSKGHHPQKQTSHRGYPRHH
jgi:hypothetical protein